MATANVFRFSSKEVHPNSGLYYYGFRFYDPTLQRWLNRDPIFESGGINLYGFVGNNPMMFVDPYGEAWYDWRWIDTAANFCAGAADDLTFGASDRLRGGLGWNDNLDKDSGGLFERRLYGGGGGRDVDPGKNRQGAYEGGGQAGTGQNGVGTGSDLSKLLRGNGMAISITMQNLLRSSFWPPILTLRTADKRGPLIALVASLPSPPHRSQAPPSPTRISAPADTSPGPRSSTAAGS